MLGLIYLCLATFVGFKLLKRFLPFIFNFSSVKTLYGKSIELPNWVVTLPGAFLIGTLFMTWVTYLTAYAFRQTGNPMLYGNITSFSVFGILAVVFIITGRKSHSIARLKDNVNPADEKKIILFFKKNGLTLVYLLFIFTFVSYFMFHSFKVQDGMMKPGWSVYSDFGPHLSMIRAFSLGQNFPTEYPHFADGHIRYHFMFQFLAGNLEYLGMRIDWAFNLPSILSMVSFLTLLYGFAVILTGKALVGALTGVFFLFRSSAAFFTFLASQNYNLKAAFYKIFTTMDFIGKTSHEDWGLWTFKDYVNQRHFAFSAGIMVLILIVVYPLFKKMIVALKRFWANLKKEKAIQQPDTEVQNLETAEYEPTPETSEDEPAPETERPKSVFQRWMEIFLLSKDAWVPESYTRPIVLGVILGSISFWHGSILIATLLVLCFMAVFSKHRLEYLMIAGITVAFSLIQSNFFVGSGSSVVSPEMVFGFLADTKTLWGVTRYYLELCGILPIVILLGLYIIPKGGRWLTLAFFIPLVFATVMTLVPDVSINHKYVAISVILLNIFAANVVYRLGIIKGILPKILAGLLVLILTITGICNTFTLYNMDKMSSGLEMKNPINEWVLKNTKTTDVFLTDACVINQILLAGRRIFDGYGYYAGSAGYDVRGRDEIVTQIYGGTDPEEVKRLLKENNIKYVVLNEATRGTKDKNYILNEDLFKNNFKLMHHFDQEGTDIYLVN